MSKKYTNENQILLPRMLEIYQPTEFDWMYTPINSGSVWTIHHIYEKHCGGNTALDNAALLLKKSHQLLNMLESRNLDLFFEWNQLFMDINVSKCPPTDEFIREMKILRKKTKKSIYGR